MRGLFITFEGIEGSGKSTQISLLADYLASRGNRVALTREPGGTTIGDQIRKILLDPANKKLNPAAELFLYAASRAQHLAEIILPALEAGTTVLCDRFSDATLAYQGFGRGVDRGLIHALDQMVTARLAPDLTILLDIDAASGLKRALQRNMSRGLEGEARFEQENIAFHTRVREGYLTLAREDPARIRIVDASGMPDAIQTTIRKIVDEVVKQTQRA